MNLNFQLPENIRVELMRERSSFLVKVCYAILFVSAIMSAFNLYILNDASFVPFRLIPVTLVSLFLIYKVKRGLNPEIGAWLLTTSLAIVWPFAIFNTPNLIVGTFLHFPALAVMNLFVLGPRKGVLASGFVMFELFVAFALRVYFSSKSQLIPNAEMIPYISGPALTLFLMTLVFNAVRRLLKVSENAYELMLAFLTNYNQLFSIIIHDFSNLNMISQIALKKGDTARVELAQSKIGSFIQTIKKLGIAISEKEYVDLANVSVDSLLKQVELLNSFYIENKKINWRSELNAPENLSIKTNEGVFVYCILQNFILNAIKFSPVGGTIELKCSQQDDQVSFDLFDEGPGVPQDVIERFTKGSRNTSTAGTIGELGLGLGLANAQNMSRRLGIKIELERLTAGGTKVHIMVPQAV